MKNRWEIGVKYVGKGTDRYVVGNIIPFDQKNEMFKRPFWDPTMLELGSKFYYVRIMPKDKPGLYPVRSSPRQRVLAGRG